MSVHDERLQLGRSMEGSNRFLLLLWTSVPPENESTPLRVRRSCPEFRSNPWRGEKTMPQVSPAEAIPRFRLRRFPDSQHKAVKASLL